MNIVDVWDSPPEKPANAAMLRAIEHATNCHFPADFRAMFLTMHGGTPACRSFAYQDPDIGTVGAAIGTFLSLDPTSPIYIPRVISTVDAGILPRGVIPFGEDGGGDLMALDFRTSAEAPSVVYVALADADEDGSGRNVYLLAPTFSAFLSMLGPSPRGGA